ncbi:MAG: T9SS C-terminal target domain-containing protein [Chitinophagaceae bacterium]|nr:MAG: T9SS C-terminal target domain-containing protein [Chitinophagaceae bacterium]
MSLQKRISVFCTLLLSVTFLSTEILYANSGRNKGEVILQLTSDNINPLLETLSAEMPESNWELKQKLVPSMPIWLLGFDESKTDINQLLSKLNRKESVLFAQWNHHVHIRELIPDDTLFNAQWNLKNTGQGSGIPGADIDAARAWSISSGGVAPTGDTMVIAIIDGGVDLNHPDLNIFTNMNEIPGTGTDVDSNGYIDDYNGWNAASENGNIPPNSHGTHVAGIAGAIGNNLTGVAGVSWNAKILPVVVQNVGNEAQVVAAYGYVYEMRKLYNETNGAAGAFIVSTNASFGIDGGNPLDYPIWCSMYDSLGKLGILNAGATVNFEANIDELGDMPTACPSPWLISVTNTNRMDQKNAGAGYGPNTIDIGAPGTGILSTRPFENYGSSTGTSMASPHLAGAVPLLLSAACDSFFIAYLQKPDSMALIVKDAIIKGVDIIPDLAERTVSGGRLNVYKSMLRIIHEHCNDCMDGTIATTATLCSGSSDGTALFELTSGNNDVSVLWPDSSVAFFRDDLEAGSYIVWASDTAGCEKAFFAEIPGQEPLELNFITNPSVGGYNNGTATAIASGGVAPYGFQWNDAANSQTQSVTQLLSGMYVVTVTDDNECVFTDSVFVDNISSIIETKKASPEVLIYPNPYKNPPLTVSFNAENTHELIILLKNVNGKTVFRQKALSPDGSTELYLPELPAGVYFLQIQQSEYKPILKKIVILP